jgi:guanylate kinase
LGKSKKGEIIAVSAPSGGGKTTIVKQILKKFPAIVFSVSATTRPKRESEKNGVEYYFITETEFKQKINNDEFVEWEKFYDYYYGTFKSVVEENVKYGKSVLLEVDVKGAISLKKIYPEAHLIYITPPSFEELVKRLRERRTESESDMKKRIERAKMELSVKDKFDYFIDNKDLNKAINDTSDLINKILNKEK